MSKAKQKEWVVVLELSDMLRLQSCKALLEAEGIEAEVLSLEVSMYPSLNRYRLVVPASNEARAVEILKESRSDA